MKLTKIGNFNSKGQPEGWIFEKEDNKNINDIGQILSIPSQNSFGPVRFMGVEIVEWTKQRNDAIEKGKK